MSTVSNSRAYGTAGAKNRAYKAVEDRYARLNDMRNLFYNCVLTRRIKMLLFVAAVLSVCQTGNGQNWWEKNKDVIQVDTLIDNEMDGPYIRVYREIMKDSMYLLGASFSPFTMVEQTVYFLDTKNPFENYRVKYIIKYFGEDKEINLGDSNYRHIRNRYRPFERLIEKGIKIDLEGLTIRGKFRLDARVIPIEGVLIKDCIFDDFSLINVKSKFVNIEDCHFKGDFAISYCQNGIYEIRKCEFKGAMNINSSFRGSFTDNKVLSSDVLFSQRYDSFRTIFILNNQFKSDVVKFQGNKYLPYPFSKLVGNNFSGAVKFENKHDTIQQFDSHSLIEDNLFENAFFTGYLPKRLGFSKNRINGRVDFSSVNGSNYTTGDFSGADIDKIRIEPLNWHFAFFQNKRDRKLSKKEQGYIQKKRYFRLENVYSSFINNAKREGLTEHEKQLDLKYKKYRYLSEHRGGIMDRGYYLIAKSWWNFGHDKYRVLFWTFYSFLCFYLINLKYFRRLLFNVYTFENIKERFISVETSSLKARNIQLKKAALGFYYTINIFFGLKLDNEGFHYKSFLPVLYVYTMYSFGLICLAFIVNYIISISF